MNAIKNVMAVVINGAASVDFIAHGLVRPGPALLMSAGAITGGVVGAASAAARNPGRFADSSWRSASRWRRCWRGGCTGRSTG